MPTPYGYAWTIPIESGSDADLANAKANTLRHTGVPVAFTRVAGTLLFRGQLQRQLAIRRGQPWLIKPDDQCPKCKENLYRVNNVPYDDWLIHRCPWCGYDLHLPSM